MTKNVQSSVKAKIEVEGMRNIILNALSQNITNGDVIKAMFPNAEIKFMVNLSDMHTVDVKFGDNTYWCYDDHTFSREWWDALYKKGDMLSNE